MSLFQLDTSTYLPCVICGADSVLDPDDKLCVQHGQNTLKGAFDLRGNYTEVFLEVGGPPQSILPGQSLPEPVSYLYQNQVLVQDQMEREDGGEQRGRKGPS